MQTETDFSMSIENSLSHFCESLLKNPLCVIWSIVHHRHTSTLYFYLKKVGKSRKQILKFSFEPKNEQKHFCISALAYKKWSNQKSSVRESK